MASQQGDLALLDSPVAQTLLQSANPARVAYVWTDGTPRVVPIWFHWTGEEVVLGTPSTAPKVKALRQNPKVALTIDSNAPPQGAADPRHSLCGVGGRHGARICPGRTPLYGRRGRSGLGRAGRRHVCPDGAHRHPPGMGGHD